MAQDIDTILSALREADAAGDIEGATRLAAMARSFSEQGHEQATQATPSVLDPVYSIIGSTGVGAGLGAVAPELLTGAGKVLGAVPQTRVLGMGLERAGDVVRAGGRAPAALAGAASGLTSEVAGQAAEAAGAGPVTAEAARFAGGAVGGESLNLAKNVLQKYALVPALGLASKFKHEGARVLLEKLNMGTETLSQRERELIESITAELRGGGGDQALERVGSIMGNEGQRLLSASDLQRVNALRAQGVPGSAGGYPGRTRELADIGGDLQATILKRNEAAYAAQKAQYKANEEARDDLVSSKEGAKQYVNDLPEYKALVKELHSQLDNTELMKRSPDVQRNYRKILSDITNPEAGKPVSFQALDDARRRLGEAFRGKPAEGYDAIDQVTAKDLYHKVSEIQKQFAGGPQGPQAKLLEDYAKDIPGLQIFSSRLGKKVTALDQFREGQYPDPSAIPGTFFKTRESVNTLKELTGNDKQVAAAALDYADKQLVGKDSAQVRKWLGDNSEWLSEVPNTKSLVMTYANRLQDAEESLARANNFANLAKADANLLIGNKLPAQRAVDLIKSGNADVWNIVTPVIARSQQAKKEMVQAVKTVVADQATSPGTEALFSRNIRPFLENAGIAHKGELDQIAKKLADIKNAKIDERAKLGLMKRVILNGTGGWLSSAGTGLVSMAWAIPTP